MITKKQVEILSELFDVTKTKVGYELKCKHCGAVEFIPLGIKANKQFELVLKFYKAAHPKEFALIMHQAAIKDSDWWKKHPIDLDKIPGL